MMDARIDRAVKDALALVGGLVVGHIPAPLIPLVETVAELVVREVLHALGVSPRVDVVAGPDAVVEVVIHDDPGAAPDERLL